MTGLAQAEDMPRTWQTAYTPQKTSSVMESVSVLVSLSAFRMLSGSQQMQKMAPILRGRESGRLVSGRAFLKF